MIYLSKSEAPEILRLHSDMWRDSLLAAVERYDGYKNIPSNEKESLIKNYKHEDIKSVLFSMSSEKCAFCEGKPGENGNIEVEHFIPKSIYPEFTFEWNNLLPSCRKCNESKGTLDTILEPIINPCEEDPESIFEYDYLIMRPIPSLDDFTIAQRTIDEIGLNSPRLLKARADLLYNLSSYLHTAEAFLRELEGDLTPAVRRNRIRSLRESIELIDNLSSSDEKYSSFTKNYLQRNEVYQRVKAIIE